MPERLLGEFDVVVVGAGVIGASCAFHLSRRGLRVAVVEARNGFAEGSSGRSFASVRAQWADPFSIEVARRSIERWRDFGTDHGHEVGYRPTGYLLLFPEEAWERQLAAVALQNELGVPSQALTPEAALRHSSFATQGLAGATWCGTDGQIDPHSATGALLALSRDRGGEVFYRFPVERAEPLPEGGWELASAGQGAGGSGGRTIRGHHVVNAAGGWGREVGALAGFDVPVVHSRRNIYASAEGFAQAPVPMTVDFTTGAYVRSEGTRILFGGMRPGEPDGYSTRVDEEWLEGLLELNGERFPWLLDMPIDLAASWAGTYENTPDSNVILGPEPEAPTWVHACGASGHGIIQAPELGRMVAEQIVDGAITSYDAGHLGIGRFRAAPADGAAAGEAAAAEATTGENVRLVF